MPPRDGPVDRQWTFEAELVSSTAEVGSGWNGSRGGAWRYGTIEMTDPRFDGEVISFSNWDNVQTATGAYIIRNTAWRVENEDGSWQSDVLNNFHFLDGSQTLRTYTFDGEGSYDGLTAIVEVDRQGSLNVLRGVIIDFDLPPATEPRSIE